MSVFSSIKDLDFEQFIAQNRIEPSDFEKANITWENLRLIGLDHESFFEARKESAEFHAKIIQGCNKVHSVRWRVKSPEHLMEKIVRKRIPNTDSYNGKYSDISVENYHEIITDLVGIRALHLFKDDYLEIDEYLKNNWENTETPIYYYRDGDANESIPEIFDKKPHHAGYRSIHYIFKSQPLNKPLFTEVQVRTIFEEGWSEIDHVVRYPNFSDDPHISTFLQIFNRLAGSADEMGAYAKSLVKELELRASALLELRNEHNKLKVESEARDKRINELLDKLKSLDNDNKQKNQLIKELEMEINKQSSENSLFDRTADIITAREYENYISSNKFSNINPWIMKKAMNNIFVNELKKQMLHANDVLAVSKENINEVIIKPENTEE